MIFAQSENPVVGLKGFDAAALVQGKETKGNEAFSIIRGRFKYLFANRAKKRKFEKNFALYEVQENGECTFKSGVPAVKLTARYMEI